MKQEHKKKNAGGLICTKAPIYLFIGQYKVQVAYLATWLIAIVYPFSHNSNTDGYISWLDCQVSQKNSRRCASLH